jgi:hypothetical protein
MGKLGATTQDATTVMVDLAALDTGGSAANGPESLIDWDAIDWRHQTDQLQRLRQRIFKGLLEPCAATSGKHGSEGASDAAMRRGYPTPMITTEGRACRPRIISHPRRT